MDSYSIKSTSCSGRMAIINSNGQILTEFKRPNPFSYKTVFEYRGLDYSIHPDNFWHSNFRLSAAGDTLGKLHWKWNGGAVLELKDFQGDWHRFRMDVKGFLDFRYEIRNEWGDLVLLIKPRMDWDKFTYNYHLEELNPPGKPIDIVLLLAFGLFSMNMSMNNISLFAGIGVGVGLI